MIDTANTQGTKMTDFEALVSISQILLRARKQWDRVDGLDEQLRRDIQATTFEVSDLLRLKGNYDEVIGLAAEELERRAAWNS